MSGFAGGFLQGLGGGMQKKKDREIRERELSAMEAMGQQRQNAQPGISLPMDVGPQGAMPADGASRPAAGMGSARTSFSGGRDAFIEAMMPHALRVSEMTGLDPRLVIAQAAQETGWGRSAPGNNFFGIKSHGKAGGATHGTHEYVNGQRVNIRDSFRQYGDMGESADGYAEFLKTNPRYRAMLSARDLDGQLDALGRSGYATDPNYARSVGSIARGITVPSAQPAPAAAPKEEADATPQTWGWAHELIKGAGQ